MELERIAITGSSGSYGRGLIRAIRDSHLDAKILGLDVRKPAEDRPDEFAAADVADDRIVSTLCAFKPDTIIHLAFVLDPIHDLERTHRINVAGAQNVLEAARQCRPQRLHVSSSATAYGAWPENPVPIPDDWPIRPCDDFAYSADKARVEHLLEAFRNERDDMAVSWTRPCIIYGPGIRNYLTRLIASAWVLPLPDGHDTRLQFVHIDDLTAATIAILARDLRGPFNIGPEDSCSMRDIARLTGRRRVSVPLATCRAFSAVWWKLRLPIFKFPPGLWSMMRHPWVVSSERLIEETDFRFRHSSLDTLKLLLADRGYLREPAGSDSLRAPT